MKKHILCFKPGVYATEILNLIAISAKVAVKKKEELIILLEYKKKKAPIIVVALNILHR